MYETTTIELVRASEVFDTDLTWALGVVDHIAGGQFGWYADCGIVIEGEIPKEWWRDSVL